MGDLMDNIMALQTAFQQVSHLAKGPSAAKLIVLKPLLERALRSLKGSLTKFFRFCSQAKDKIKREKC